MNKKKKVLIICIVCICLVIIPYISYQILTYFPYYIHDIHLEESEKIIKNLKNEEFATITKKDYQGDYFEYENIKIANEFNEFLLSDKMKSYNMYTYKDKATFVIGTKEKELNKLREVQEYCINCKEIIEQIITENNLKNDMDLFNYLKSYDFSKSTFLTKTKNMKSDYVINDYIIMFMPQFSKIIYINGDYNGYIYELERGYEVVLEKDNKQYIFVFTNHSGSSYYTKEKVYDLISTIVIE